MTEPDLTVTEQIAELLDQQTYDERMDMAGWWESAVNGWLEDQPADYVLTKADFALWFSAYAEEMRAAPEETP